MRGSAQGKAGRGPVLAGKGSSSRRRLPAGLLEVKVATRRLRMEAVRAARKRKS